MLMIASGGVFLSFVTMYTGGDKCLFQCYLTLVNYYLDF